MTEYFKEVPVTMPEDIVGCLDFQYGEDGEYQAIGQDEKKALYFGVPLIMARTGRRHGRFPISGRTVL